MKSDYGKSDKALFTIMESLNGFETMEAKHVLYLAFLMINNKRAKNIINIEQIKEVWFPELKVKVNYFSFGGHHYLMIEENRHLVIYLRISTWYSKLIPNSCMYYKLPNQQSKKLKKLTKENLLNSFIDTMFEYDLRRFLLKENIYKKDQKTGKLEILKVF